MSLTQRQQLFEPACTYDTIITHRTCLTTGVSATIGKAVPKEKKLLFGRAESLYSNLMEQEVHQGYKWGLMLIFVKNVQNHLWKNKDGCKDVQLKCLSLLSFTKEMTWWHLTPPTNASLWSQKIYQRSISPIYYQAYMYASRQWLKAGSSNSRTCWLQMGWISIPWGAW